MSKKILLTIIAAIIYTSGYGKKTEEELVRESFDKYKSSILNDQGTNAIKYVDSRTINYYSEMLDKTKHADSVEVNSMGILDKLMVFAIRHRASKDDILSFDGKGLLVYAIKSGMVGKNSVASNTVGDISIDGKFAKGQLITNGQKTPLYFHFYKEKSVWKLDLTSLFPAGAIAFKKMQEGSGMNENEYLFMLLEMITGKKPGTEIWNTIE